MKADIPPTPYASRTTALVLSGGLAIGAYHAGVCAALDAAGGPAPHWFAGCSIGAVTAAILAGSRPGDRVAQLRRFWDTVGDPAPAMPTWAGQFWAGQFAAAPWQQALSWASATRTGVLGCPGLFRPRLPMADDPTPGLYDLTPLHDHLARLVDFGRLNGGDVRVSLTATDVVTGERVVFDTARGDRIGPEHVVASSALLPLFAPVKLDGRLLGDGGLTGNTPLDVVLHDPDAGDLTVFASDLFGLEGTHPRSLAAAAARAGDIVFGNQTRQVLEAHRREHRLRTAVADLIGKLPPGTGAPDAARLRTDGRPPDVAVLHLGYRAGVGVAGVQKALSYTEPTLVEHWQAGERDMRAALSLLGAAPVSGLSIHSLPNPRQDAEAAGPSYAR